MRRSRDNNGYLGCGYPLFVKASPEYENPGEYEFINRIVDAYARIKADIINLKPDYLSIYIGVNDVWHELGHKNGFATPQNDKAFNKAI